ncbi:MAG: hypothetical protein Q8Q12_01400 [bacterium]|nr:hypothetical protein [bacterium]
MNAHVATGGMDKTTKNTKGTKGRTAQHAAARSGEVVKARRA